MKLPSLFQFRILKEVFRALTKGPYTTKFPFEPHKPYERFRGKPVPDEKVCIGCGACAEVCPPRSILITDNLTANPPVRVLKWRHDFCIFCGQCERICTTKDGVKLSNEFDLADITRKNMFSEIKKELVICSDCKDIIAPKDQILHIAKKLGTQAYSNINIIALTQQEFLSQWAGEPAPEFTPHRDAGRRGEFIHPSEISDSPQPLLRQTAFKVLCPKCRHQQWVFDDYNKTS